MELSKELVQTKTANGKSKRRNINESITVPELIEYTGFSEPTINRALKTLRETGLIVRVGAKKNGHWELAISNLQ